MRVMFLLYGAPGSGKSNFASTHFMYGVTVSRSDIERMFAPTVSTFDGSTRVMRTATKNYVQETLLRIVATRMEEGTTIVLDDPENVKVSIQEAWKNFAEKYGYTVVLVDVQGDKELDELKRVVHYTNTAPIPVVERFYKVASKHPKLTVIRPDEFDSWFFTPTVSHGNTPTMVVGDVQSASERLRVLVSDYDTPDMRWVFTGDLTDRGNDPAGVIRLVQSLGERAVRVMGNHDEHLYSVVTGRSNNRLKQTMRTVEALKSAGFTDGDIMDWANGFVPFYDFTVGENRYFASHGGVALDKLPATENGVHLGTVHSDVSFIQGTRNSFATRRGIGDYNESIDFLLSVGSQGNGFFDAQFHGHRNSAKAEADAHEGVYNLESRAEFADGHLTSALITPDNVTVITTA